MRLWTLSGAHSVANTSLLWSPLYILYRSTVWRGVEVIHALKMRIFHEILLELCIILETKFITKCYYLKHNLPNNFRNPVRDMIERNTIEYRPEHFDRIFYVPTTGNVWTPNQMGFLMSCSTSVCNICPLARASQSLEHRIYVLLPDIKPNLELRAMGTLPIYIP